MCRIPGDPTPIPVVVPQLRSTLAADRPILARVVRRVGVRAAIRLSESRHPMNGGSNAGLQAGTGRPYRPVNHREADWPNGTADADFC